MADLAAFASSIPVRRLFSLDPNGQEVPLRAIAALDGAVDGSGNTALHCALRELLVRLAETHLLSHPRLVRLIEVWDGIIGTAKERVAGHLEAILGGPPSPELVDHIYRCLAGSAARRGRHRRDHEYYFEDVLRRIATTARGELRCECCGYHFRAKDLSNERLRSALEAGLTVEKSLFPGRANDVLKPTQGFKQDSLTRLSVDHIIPQETLGWSEADNLEILCAFCNFGKLAYRRPMELLSVFAVGALANVPRDRGWGGLKHQIVVSTLRAQGGVCCSCERTRLEAELTVRPSPREGDVYMRGFAPWNLRTLCYVCLEDLDDDLQPDVDDFTADPEVFGDSVEIEGVTDEGLEAETGGGVSPS